MGISRQQALDCFRSDDLIGVGMEADAVRRRLHPEGVVTYRCVQQLGISDLQLSAEAVLSVSSSGVRLICSTAARVPLVKDVCSATRNRYPCLWIEVGLNADAAVEPHAIAALAEWHASGADSIFIDPRQEQGNYAATCAASLTLHRAAHKLGMRTAVAIPFGCGESLDERLDFLEAVRHLQEETGGFAAFVPLGLDARAGRELDGVTAVERLKTLAVARMVLDNIEHLQSAQVGSGLKVLQTGLRFGADDTEIRLPQTGTTEQDLRRVIRDAGFRPVERDGSYSTMFLD